MRSWILTLTGTALLTCAVMAITPACRAKRVVRLVCAFAMLLALISPVRSFDYDTFARKAASLREGAAGYSVKLGDTNNQLSRLFIQEECEAYIMDKGEALGLRLTSADVAMRWSPEGYWYPEEVSVTGAGEGAARGKLETFITSELGIAPERVTWVDADEA